MVSPLQYSLLLNKKIMKGYTQSITLFDEVTATTIAPVVDADGWQYMSMQVTRADHASGSSAFTVEVSNDNSSWAAYDMLIDNLAADAGTGTAGEDIAETRLTTKTLSGNGTDMVYFDPVYRFRYLKVTVTEATDGTHSAKLYIQY